MLVPFGLFILGRTIGSWNEQLVPSVFLIQNSGLLNQQSEKQWGFMLGQPQLSLKNEFPDLWDYINQHPSGGDFIDSDHFSSFIRLKTFYSATSEANTHYLTLVVNSNHKRLRLANNKALYVALSIFFVFSAIGLLINWRDYRYQLKLVELSLKIRTEQQELKQLNKTLFDNIARQQLLQDELVEANKLSSLGLMVAGLAHELNTPIGGAIISVSNADNANTLLQKAMLDGISKTQFSQGVESINSSLHIAKINLDKAVKLVKHFKRLAIDRVNEDRIECLLDSVVDDLVISLSPRLKQSKVELISEIAPNIKLISRPGIISQVLENLVINSLVHAFAHNQTGEIVIKASNYDANRICITVSDNGNGIPVKLQSNIFDPFVTSGRSKGNIGLGLFMVNQWVTKLLKGQLSFISEKNPNHPFVTRFIIVIPIDASHEQSP